MRTLEDENPNVRAKTMLAGTRGAVAWAIIISLALLPIWVVPTAIHWVMLTVVFGMSFALNQILEDGATKYFNLYQIEKSLNMDDMIKSMKALATEIGRENSPENNEGTKED